ncbi:MAG: hypothetical protein FWF10_06255 [Clostridiales bacterium]|nr:hypothetical protein [Clostridiales bacterium]
MKKLWKRATQAALIAALLTAVACIPIDAAQYVPYSKPYYRDWAMASANRNDWAFIPADAGIRESVYRNSILDAIHKEKKNQSGWVAELVAGYVLPDGTELEATDQNGRIIFIRTVNGVSNTYAISGDILIATQEIDTYTYLHEAYSDPAFLVEWEALRGTISGEMELEIWGETYHVEVSAKGRNCKLYRTDMPIAIITLNVYLPLDDVYAPLATNYEFVSAVEDSLAQGWPEFSFAGATYALHGTGGPDLRIADANGKLIMQISDLYFSALNMDTTLPAEFILTATEAYRAGESSFVFPLETQVTVATEALLYKLDENGKVYKERETLMVPISDEAGKPIYEIQDVEFRIRFSNGIIYFQRESYV